MRRLALCLIALFCFASPCYATLYIATGTVYLLRSHDIVYGADVDWFSLVGVSALGVCKTLDAGYVVLHIRDDQKGQRMFALALAAKTAGMPLTVFVDDTLTDANGFCYVRAVQQ